MAKNFSITLTLVFTLLLATCTLTGCATVQATNPNDPFEGYNRAMFKFNMKVDKFIIRPAAFYYDTRVPGPIRKWVSNFLDNLDQIPTIANDLLQLDLYHAVYNTWRFAINTTVGILGTVDVASHLGLTPRYNDLGLTFAKWGIMRKSPYFVIPLIGPSTIRDTIAEPVNYYYLTVYPHIKTWPRYTLLYFYALNSRAKLLAADKLLDEAFDPYILVRNAYLQKRNAQIKRELNHEETIVDDTYVEGNDEDEEEEATTQGTQTNNGPLSFFNPMIDVINYLLPFKRPAVSADVQVPYRSAQT